jgi:hypothetical protein
MHYKVLVRKPGMPDGQYELVSTHRTFAKAQESARKQPWAAMIAIGRRGEYGVTPQSFEY